MTDQPDEGLTIAPDYVATMFDLRGRVAAVTGGGSGLGAAISIGYAQAGVTVVILNEWTTGRDRGFVDPRVARRG